MNIKKLGLVGLLASGLSFSNGCSDNESANQNEETSQKFSNTSLEISSGRFGDKDFNSPVNFVNINRVEYAFSEIPNDSEFKVNGKAVESLPFVAYERSKMITTIDIEKNTLSFGYDDNSALGFVRDEKISAVTITTTRTRAKREKMPDSLTAKLPEDRFQADYFNFGKKYERVFWAQDNDKIILIPNAKIVINNLRGDKEGGLIQYIGDSYVSQIGKIEKKPVPVLKTQPAILTLPPEFLRQDYIEGKIEKRK